MVLLTTVTTWATFILAVAEPNKLWLTEIETVVLPFAEGMYLLNPLYMVKL
jgi:hypothetical protein